MIKILQQENPILRKTALPVSHKDIGSKKLQSVLEDMSQALVEQGDGVAIAAPQIGVSLRIFVVAGKIFEDDFVRGEKEVKKKKNPKKDLVFINPEIIKKSKDRKSVPEGCLSVRWLYGKTKRASKVTVEAYDEEGNKFEQEGTGLMAQIFQHEIDHLNGILFIDHAKNLEEIPPEDGNAFHAKK
jgi:peptide deformylase